MTNFEHIEDNPDVLIRTVIKLTVKISLAIGCNKPFLNISYRFLDRTNVNIRLVGTMTKTLIFIWALRSYNAL